MAEQAAHVLDAGAALEQQAREGVTERVRGEVLRQPRRLRALFEGLPPPGVGVMGAHVRAEHVLGDGAPAVPERLGLALGPQPAERRDQVGREVQAAVAAS